LNVLKEISFGRPRSGCNNTIQTIFLEKLKGFDFTGTCSG
jgi:hypothetical protein